MSRVFVTGATGFLGGRLVRRLVETGHEVAALCRPASSRSHLAGLAIRWTEGDLLDEAALAAGMADCEAVFHSAAVLGIWKGLAVRQRETNVLGTRAVCAAALKAGISRLVHTSSIVAVGLPAEGSEADEETPFTSEAAHSPYASTKHEAELEVLEAVAQGLDAVIVNPGVIFGIRPNRHYAMNLLETLAAGKLPVYPTGGACWIWLDDAVEGHLLAWARGRRGRRYILGGHNLPYRDFMGTVCRLAGSRPPFLPTPGPVLGAAAAAAEWVASLTGRHPPLSRPMARLASRHLYYASRRAETELGWRATPLEDAIRRALAARTAA